MAYNQDSVSIVCVSSNRSLPRAGARDIHLFSSPVSSQSTDLPNSRLMASSTAPPGSFAGSKEERLVYRSSPVEEIGQIAGIRNGRLRQEPEAVQVLRLTEKQMAKWKEKGEGDKSPPLLTSEVAYSPAIAPNQTDTAKARVGRAISREFGKSVDWLLTGEEKKSSDRLPPQAPGTSRRAAKPRPGVS